MTLNIEAETEVSFPFDYGQVAKEAICFTMEHEGFPFEAEVNLLLTDDDGIRCFNKEYRMIDAPTDVLSFPMIEFEKAGDFSQLDAESGSGNIDFNPDTGEAVLGDIVISAERVASQAESYGHSSLREFAFLIVHSMLHLFGYDHMAEEDAAVMEDLQHRILEEMHIPRA